MRLPALFLALLLLAVLGSPSESRAEKVKTNQETNLLSRPGERGKVLRSVPEGKVMKVVAKDGRWLKVRVSGITGWVPRSKVDIDEEIARNTRRRPFVDGRGKGRGFGGEEGPDDRIGADAIGKTAEPNTGDDGDDGDDGGKGGKRIDVNKPNKGETGKPGKGETGKPGKGETGKPGKGEPAKGDGGKGGKGKPSASEDEEGDAIVVDEEEPAADDRPTAHVKAKTVAFQEPADDAEESFSATPKMVLYPTGNKKGKFTEVENDDGDLGYVPTSSLEGGGGGGGSGGGGSVSRRGEVGEPRGKEIDARARLGVTFISQTNAPGGAHVGTSAVTLALGGAYTTPYKEKYILGGEVTYDYAKAIPGVKGPMGMGTTSIGLHNLRLRALAGYDLKKPSGMALFGRLGFHYQSYQVADVGDLTKNTAMLPSEIIKAAAIGAGLDIPRLSGKIGVHGSLDAVFAVGVSQTKNLEDGKSPAAKGALFDLGMTYHWKKDMNIVAAYDLTYFSMSFGAAVPTSKRPMLAGGNATRGDQFHVFTAGIAKAF